MFCYGAHILYSKGIMSLATPKIVDIKGGQKS